MVEEYNSIMKNDVWEVILRPKGKSVVISRWLYKIKYVVDGSIEKFKARFVAQGFSQVEGVDYDETFTLIARYTLIGESDLHCSRDGLEDPSDGCEDNISEWSHRGGSVH
jgi:hypothetical protein